MGLLVQEACKERRAIRGIQVYLEIQVRQDLMVLQDQRGLQDYKVRQDQLEHRVLKVLLVRQDLQEPHQLFLVPQVRRVSLEILEWLQQTAQ
jgi:hypothetical protein